MTTNTPAPSRPSPQPANYAFLPPDPPPQAAAAASTSPPPTRFRFKSKPGKRDRDSNDNGDPHTTASHTRKRHRRSRSPHGHHRHHHHHHRRRHHDNDSYNYHHNDDLNTLNTDSETAFRASLFDALADDEGAAFWEGVYGQPIHTYPNVRSAPAEARHDGTRHSAEDAGGSPGDIHRMPEDEYVAYVRAKMWEKTHEAAMEERERRRRAAERQAEEKRQREKERAEWKEGMRGHAAWTREVEDGLRRGERRKEEKRTRERWGAYVEAWDGLGKKDAQDEKDKVKARLPWPVASGRVADVSRKGEVESFFTRGASISEGVKGDLRALLKQERVRWHPDKMQQRFGALDDETLQAVTAVFQIVGRLWEDTSDDKT